MIAEQCGTVTDDLVEVYIGSDSSLGEERRATATATRTRLLRTALIDALNIHTASQSQSQPAHC